MLLLMYVRQYFTNIITIHLYTSPKIHNSNNILLYWPPIDLSWTEEFEWGLDLTTTSTATLAENVRVADLSKSH